MNPLPQAAGFLVRAKILPYNRPYQKIRPKLEERENEHELTIRIAMSRMPDPVGKPAHFFLSELFLSA
jgi:hypothetical protein